jgi:hypothetical protein
MSFQIKYKKLFESQKGFASNSIHAAQALVHLCGEGEQHV